MQVILERREDWPAPAWRVTYRKLPTDAPALDLPVGARTGAAEVSFPIYRLDAAGRARQELGGAVTLVGTGATWWSPAFAAAQPGGGYAAGLEAPIARTFAFSSADGRGRDAAFITYDTRQGLVVAARGAPLAALPESPPARGRRCTGRGRSTRSCALQRRAVAGRSARIGSVTGCTTGRCP